MEFIRRAENDMHLQNNSHGRGIVYQGCLNIPNAVSSGTENPYVPV